jgi:hypothetical protein
VLLYSAASDDTQASCESLRFARQLVVNLSIADHTRRHTRRTTATNATELTTPQRKRTSNRIRHALSYSQLLYPDICRHSDTRSRLRVAAAETADGVCSRRRRRRCTRHRDAESANVVSDKRKREREEERKADEERPLAERVVLSVDCVSARCIAISAHRIDIELNEYRI